MGEPDMDAAMKKLEKYTLAGVAGKIECPTLIMHGERDSLSPNFSEFPKPEIVRLGRVVRDAGIRAE